MGKVLFQKYEIINQIGQGGMGKVFLARDLNLDRLVAVKEGDLYREMKLLRELVHPGLPMIYDFFQEDGNAYLVMEYVEGISLRKYLEKNKQVPEQLAVEWAMELCGILDYLHQCKPPVIYRDLKPENIMIQPDGRLKLIDMGAALRYTCGHQRQQLCMGTPGYNPKEQWKETKGNLTWDIYGLGAVLHEMLTGANPMRPPYERRALREYNKGFSKGLEQIIEVCTRKKSTDRYQNAEQLRQALENHHKLGRKSRCWWRIKKLITVIFFAIAGWNVVIPLFYGVPEQEIPFPYLEMPLFWIGLTLIFKTVFLRRKKAGSCLRKQEKNIWLTQKQFSGLYLLFFFLFGSLCGAGLFQMSGQASWIENSGNVVYAGETDERLWVEMRDQQGRKMLLKDGAVYVPEKSVRFEIPVESLPEGEVRLQMIAEDDNGKVYISRDFSISKTQ